MPHPASRNHWNKYVGLKMFGGAVFWGGLVVILGTLLALRVIGVT